MTRAAAIKHARTGATKLWAGTVVVQIRGEGHRRQWRTLMCGSPLNRKCRAQSGSTAATYFGLSTMESSLSGVHEDCLSRVNSAPMVITEPLATAFFRTVKAVCAIYIVVHRLLDIF